MWECVLITSCIVGCVFLCELLLGHVSSLQLSVVPFSLDVSELGTSDHKTGKHCL